MTRTPHPPDSEPVPAAELAQTLLALVTRGDPGSAGVRRPTQLPAPLDGQLGPAQDRALAPAPAPAQPPVPARARAQAPAPAPAPAPAQPPVPARARAQ